MEKALPPIPAKRYFTIGEVGDLCGVKPHVLRYWEQEFTQLKPMKRRGNRRYYQHHEVLLVRRIRELLYEQGFTISGARNRLTDGQALAPPPHAATVNPVPPAAGMVMSIAAVAAKAQGPAVATVSLPAESEVGNEPVLHTEPRSLDGQRLRAELLSIRDLLVV